MELRKDYVLDRWVFYAADRKKRPKEFKKIEDKEPLKACFFCRGNESLTPPEIGRAEEKGDWIIRGVNGELYPCKPDIFEKTYELVF